MNKQEAVMVCGDDPAYESLPTKDFIHIEETVDFEEMIRLLAGSLEDNVVSFDFHVYKGSHVLQSDIRLYIDNVKFEAVD
ncbi:MAG: hypothetical protein HN790_02470 [Methylococcales bacterium]|jgi:hypothetical protein|nr:hypothetical protein [Methylococcales bacterium]